MLMVQEYLSKFEDKYQALESLNAEFGIKYNIHPSLNLVILNYDMIESPKTNTIVRECRGLVLDLHNGWKLIARSFFRFFNHGETLHLDFDWSNDVEAFHKEDGSLILYYNYKNGWRVNTRASFGDGEINDTGKTWKSLFDEAFINLSLKEELKDITYVFELCSMYNKIVRKYPVPTLYLLASFDKEGEEIDIYGDSHFDGFNKPTRIIIKSLDEAISYIRNIEANDATFEGLVLKDSKGNRMKVKSSSYLMLHRSANNGNIVNIKNIIPIILEGEVDEILSYFPELKSRFNEISSKIDYIKNEISIIWDKYKHINNKKEFANLILAETKYSAPLFAAFDKNTDPLLEIKENYLIRVIENM